EVITGTIRIGFCGETLFINLTILVVKVAEVLTGLAGGRGTHLRRNSRGLVGSGSEQRGLNRLQRVRCPWLLCGCGLLCVSVGSTPNGCRRLNCFLFPLVELQT